MSGGKGGSTTSSVTIPEYIEAAAQRNLNKAERISQIGYTPYYGPDVAAFTPMQQAAFQGTAQTAGAFGLPGGGMSQQDIMGGMPAPTTYAGGVQGYSAAPIYEQSLQTLGERRPGQKAYIDSFFIDPYAGGAAAGNFAPIDYTSYGTAAQSQREREALDREAQLMTEQMRMQGSALSAPQYNTYVTSIQEAISDTSYDPRIDVLTPEQQVMIQNNPQAQLAQDDLYMNQLGNANSNIIDAGKGLFNIEPSFDSPSSSGSYGGSLVTGGLSGDLTPIPGILGNVADSVASSIAPEYAMGQQGKDFAASGGSEYDPNMVITNPITGTTTSGGYSFDPSAFSSDYGTVDIPVGVSPATPIPVVDTSSSVVSDTPDTSITATPAAPAIDDLPGNVISRALNVGAGAKDSSTDSGYAGSSGDGCVVATHAVNSGAFSPSAKREAVVWCMNVLHGKWWGEAIRRGYRHLGRSKIEQGKAHEHYQEFRDYIAFASGKKRTVKGAIHFAARTAQFFAVGLVKKDS
jgi:hypothetical protein